jgi:hypothetical protein
MYTLQSQSLFMTDKPILLSDNMLHKNNDHKGSAAQEQSLVVTLKGLGTKTK